MMTGPHVLAATDADDFSPRIPDIILVKCKLCPFEEFIPIDQAGAVEVDHVCEVATA